MIVHFKETKANICYENFVKNPENRTFRKAFLRQYNNIAEAAVKIHERLENFTTVADYNSIWGCTDNRIEIVHGRANDEPLIMKTRINACFRKFFYHEKKDGLYTIMKEWAGNFTAVDTIFVIEINKHDYRL